MQVELVKTEQTPLLSYDELMVLQADVIPLSFTELRTMLVKTESFLLLYFKNHAIKKIVDFQQFVASN